MGPTDRFVSKVATTLDDGCWQWTGAVLPSGYGKFSVGRRQMMAHRFSYETFVGAIPDGLQIDHLCRNRGCVKPSHLEAVTARTNLLRGNTTTARNAAVTVCPQGHDYDEANTYVSKRGIRYCRSCDRDRKRAKRAAA